DPSGWLVSREYRYLENARPLLEFLWRYNHLSDEERGFDPTAVTATNAERIAFFRALRQYVKCVKAGERHPVPLMHAGDHKGYPVQKVAVRDEISGKTSYYIVAKPDGDSMSPFGPCTRRYVALPVDAIKLARSGEPKAGSKYAHRLVHMKDTWRTADYGLQSETSIHREMSSMSVPHLSNLIRGGDVHSPNGRLQETIAHVFA
ncbi:hypothetical protein K474DRAFT_1600222, partial [Panus rudis PR-1116 ss-1]